MERRKCRQCDSARRRDFGRSRSCEEGDERCRQLRRSVRSVGASIVCRGHGGKKREMEFSHMTRDDSDTLVNERFRRGDSAPPDARAAGRDGKHRGALTGSRRSISTLHLWQKNRDIGLPSTTASAMFYVSLSSPSLLAAVTVGSIRLRSVPVRLDSGRLASTINAAK